MVAQATLTRLVMVRIHVGQPFDAVQARLAHGLRPAYSNNVNTMMAEARRMVPSLSRGTTVVYLLRQRSGLLYVGASADLEQRLNDHASGQACRTTALDPPVALRRVEVCSTFSEARQRETQLKRWSRAKKEALIEGNHGALSALSRSATNRSPSD
jgi:putative endonuclease